MPEDASIRMKEGSQLRDDTEVLNKVVGSRPDRFEIEAADLPRLEPALEGLRITHAVISPITSGATLHGLQRGWHYQMTDRNPPNYTALPVRKRTRFVRTGLHGDILRTERSIQRAVSLNPENSNSLSRAPAPRRDFVRGRGSYFPFVPGGLADEDAHSKASPTVRDASISSNAYLRGVTGLPETEPFVDSEPGFYASSDPAQWVLPRKKHKATQVDTQEIDESTRQENPATAAVDAFLPSEFALVRSRAALPITRSKEKAWAHMVDVSRPMKNFRDLIPDLAFEHPFELDNFQKEAIYHLEQNESVFVAAHTSAGKTVVAEYAIALATKHLTRAIYTSPIKALSNQKYRDFRTTFDSVGILTGDVQLNPEASCLIMTTEILRSMLYRGADLIRDVEFVIFDEVHYVNDQERGVVWEEVIIMLPSHVTLILLSATVPNTFEFANWVGRTKQKDIYVISTLKRPVPLEHHLYANRTLFKIVDENKQWLSTGYRSLKDALQRNKEVKIAPNQGTGRGRGANRGSGQHNARGRGSAQPFARGGTLKTMERHDKNVWVHLVHQLNAQKLLPTVIFVFSKKRCEDNASTLSNVDLCNGTERSQIHIAVSKAVASLSADDQQLPQIIRMRELLSRGIGVHHGGLLPIVKEIVEILFARGLVKVLFATETFAMGVNMPAKSVVFSGIRKHDGQGFRDLTPGEYTQMAGRAGRRGLDATGTVIIICSDEPPEQGILQTMLLGQPFKLISQFRLTYNMILNLLRVETLEIEEMIKRSFSENASQSLRPEHERLVSATQRKLDEMECHNSSVDHRVRAHHAQSIEYALISNNIIITSIEQLGRRVFGQGRVVLLRAEGTTRHIGVLLGESATSCVKHRSFSVFALRPDASNRKATDLMPYVEPLRRFIQLPLEQTSAEVEVIAAMEIDFVTNCVLTVDPVAVRRRVKADWDALRGCLAQLSQDSTLQEVEWIRQTRDIEVRDLLHRRSEIAAQLAELDPTRIEGYAEQYVQCHERHLLHQQMLELKHAMSNQNLELLPDYEQRCAVLRDLGFLSQRNRVSLKGRVACEIEGEYELVLTELMLDNALTDFDHAETCALLSAFVFQERSDTRPLLSAKLNQGIALVCARARRVDEIQEHHQVLVTGSAGDDDWTADAARFGLVGVCEAWARGMSFKEICEMTDVLEGTIVRCIVRLDEVLRACQSAARVVGDTDTYTKLEECRELIKRDVVFSASLFW
ncbi:Antiviral helicase ski2 [Savitreella phatthalungensis]